MAFRTNIACTFGRQRRGVAAFQLSTSRSHARPAPLAPAPAPHALARAMFLSRTLPLARAAPAWASSLTAAPKRRMGGLTNVKKNYWVEEWNGKREITEKTFELNGKSLTKIFARGPRPRRTPPSARAERPDPPAGVDRPLPRLHPLRRQGRARQLAQQLHQPRHEEAGHRVGGRFYEGDSTRGWGTRGGGVGGEAHRHSSEGPSPRRTPRASRSSSGQLDNRGATTFASARRRGTSQY